MVGWGSRGRKDVIEISKESLLGLAAKKGRSQAGIYLGNDETLHIHRKWVSQGRLEAYEEVLFSE